MDRYWCRRCRINYSQPNDVYCWDCIKLLNFATNYGSEGTLKMEKQALLGGPLHGKFIETDQNEYVIPAKPSRPSLFKSRVTEDKTKPGKYVKDGMFFNWVYT